jgi:thiol-disulfide isomerase/thioredoxin
MKKDRFTRLAAVAAVIFIAGTAAFSQASGVKVADVKPVAATQRVTQIDLDGLKMLLKPNGKPLMINFWATWCDPCRDEFPDVVKIDNDYRGKIDVITISLDDLADINTFVPKFLAEMKARMPAYLLHTTDEDAAIKMISSDWGGNLPMTVVYGSDGKLVYKRNGKIFYQTVAANLDKLLNSTPDK